MKRWHNMDDQEKKLHDLWNTLTVEEQRTFTALRKRLAKMPEKYWRNRPPWKKHYRCSGFSNPDEFAQGIAELRKMADDPPAVSKKLRQRPPLRIEDRFIKLRIAIYEAECAHAEDWDVQASPDALRFLAEKMAEDEQKLRKQKAEEKAEEEWLRHAAEQIRRRVASTPLDVLNLPSNATAEQIKKRYHHLIKHLHPDSNRGDDAATGLLRQVTEAMDQLRSEGRA